MKINKTDDSEHQDAITIILLAVVVCVVVCLLLYLKPCCGSDDQKGYDDMGYDAHNSTSIHTNEGANISLEPHNSGFGRTDSDFVDGLPRTSVVGNFTKDGFAKPRASSLLTASFNPQNEGFRKETGKNNRGPDGRSGKSGSRKKGKVGRTHGKKSHDDQAKYNHPFSKGDRVYIHKNTIGMNQRSRKQQTLTVGLKGHIDKMDKGRGCVLRLDNDELFGITVTYFPHIKKVEDDEFIEVNDSSSDSSGFISVEDPSDPGVDPGAPVPATTQKRPEPKRQTPKPSPQPQSEMAPVSQAKPATKDDASSDMSSSLDSSSTAPPVQRVKTQRDKTAPDVVQTPVKTEVKQDNAAPTKPADDSASESGSSSDDVIVQKQPNAKLKQMESYTSVS